jgi:hypothetical protein
MVILAPTAISPFGIQGWTISYELGIPVMGEFVRLCQNHLQGHQS